MPEPRTYKEGDRVRYIGDQTPERFGKTGVVRTDQTGSSVQVVWDDGTTRTTGPRWTNLELIESVPLSQDERQKIASLLRAEDGFALHGDEADRLADLIWPKPLSFKERIVAHVDELGITARKDEIARLIIEEFQNFIMTTETLEDLNRTGRVRVAAALED